MKLNKKIIIPALSLLAGASLVGSVSGTIAWYQYSTRANVSYIGSSAGVIGNLQVKLATDDDSKWGPQVRTEDVLEHLRTSGYGQAVEPVTPGALEKNDFLKELKWDAGELLQHGAVNPNSATNPLDTAKLYVWDKVEQVSADPLQYQTDYSAWEYKPDNIDDEEPWKKTTAIAIDPLDDEKAAHKNDAEYQYIDSTSHKLFSKEVGDDKQFYLNPTFGNDSYDKWIKAETKHYVKIPLQLRFVGNNESDLKAKDIYLSKLLIQRDRQSNPNDISDAIRVHFSAYEDGDEIHAINHLVSKNGGTIATEGRLRLGRGSDFDQAYEDENDVWGFNENNEYKYVEYGEGSQTAYGSVLESEDSANELYQYYTKYHNYYEGDESTTSSKPWKNVALKSDPAISVPVSETAKTVDEGNPGDLYIKKVNVGQPNESRELYKKGDNVWKVLTDESIVKVGEGKPSGNKNCEYFIRKHNDLFASLWHCEVIHDDVLDTDTYLWTEITNSTAVYDDQAEVVLDKYCIDTVNLRLIHGEKSDWELMDSSEYEYLKETSLSEKPLTEKADGYVKGKYYIDSNDKLYEFIGDIYKEKISPVLVKESANPDTPLLLEGTESDKVIAKTTEGHVVNVDVTIWVEGWQKFEKAGKFSSIWESGYIQSMFDVGMQFAVQDLRA